MWRTKCREDGMWKRDVKKRKVEDKIGRRNVERNVKKVECGGGMWKRNVKKRNVEDNM